MGKFKLFSTSARLFCFVGITFSETDMDYYGKSYSFTVVYLCYPTKAKNFKKKRQWHYDAIARMMIYPRPLTDLKMHIM